ncbi:hypothetical protein D3H65_29945 [Paraflavitalea soli]|uniref:Uncharacterized protein n=1 Tax=Paraflavitalea soli TaxID=2315862 RepID=A0A3B7MXK8_9BACT|nr:hypothetical protein [Paraflavitalea soli]AXY77959.1 hypothetical protein D3H65_29945 [Paraflavitalea soli]
MPTRKKKSTKPGKTSALPELTQQHFLKLLEQFFENYHLNEVDQHLWDWLVAALTREHCIYSSATERANLIFLYENLKDLFKELWRLHNNRQHKAAH